MRNGENLTDFVFAMGKIEQCFSLGECPEQGKLHQHHQYIFYLIQDGSGGHNIDLKEYQIQSGRTFFISPGQIHKCNSEEVSGYYITFDLAFYHHIKTRFKLYDFPFFHTTLEQPCFDLGEHFPEILVFVEQIYGEYKAEESFGKWSVIRYELEMLFIYLTRIRQKMEANEIETIVPNNEKLRRLELLIEEYFREQKGVGFYAENLHLSSRHLNNIIAQKTGKSISEMIQDRTLIEGKRLLLYSEKTVSEIAEELGFSDKAYFHRFFRKKTGSTPLEFRNEFLKVHH